MLSIRASVRTASCRPASIPLMLQEVCKANLLDGCLSIVAAQQNANLCQSQSSIHRHGDLQVPDVLLDLLQQCFSFNPLTRPSVPEILEVSCACMLALSVAAACWHGHAHSPWLQLLRLQVTQL